MTKEELIKNFKQYHLVYCENKNKNVRNFNINNHYICQDDNGYFVSVSIYNLRKGTKPIKFSKTNNYTLHNIQLWLKLNHKTCVLLPQQMYIGNNSYLAFRCECGNVFSTTWQKMLERNKCYCTNCMNKHHLDTIRISPKQVENLFTQHHYKLIDVTQYKNNSQPLECINEEGYYGFITYNNLLKHNNVQIRPFSPMGNNYKNVIKNLQLFVKINHYNCEIIDYYGNIHLESDTYIKCKCQCGKYFYPTISNLIIDKQFRCNECSSMSKLEQLTKNYLDAKNIQYIQQYTFNDCKNHKCLPFDFYLPQYNCCIEVDGHLHFRPSNWRIDESEKEHRFQTIQKHDNIKTQYCQQNNIPLLRIPYWDFYRVQKKNSYILSYQKDINDFLFNL